MLESKANWSYIETNDLFVDEQREKSTTLSPVIKELLVQRGITTTAEAEMFLNPDFSGLHHPSQLRTMELAVERILKAIEQQENILVFGDYDAGATRS